MRRIYLLTCLTIALLACESEKPNDLTMLDNLFREYNLQPVMEAGNTYLDSLSSVIGRNKLNKVDKSKHLLQAIKVAEQIEDYYRIPSFLLPLLREDLSTEERDKLLPILSASLKRVNKNHAATAVDLARIKYGNILSSELKQNGLDTMSIDGFMKSLFDNILVDTDETGVNRLASMRYVDATEALALAAPSHPGVPENLYKAAEVARSIRTLPKAMTLYDWILEEYPAYTDYAKVMFIKAYLMEYEYQDLDAARKLYEQFLAKYPSHEFSESAKFLLNNMGKSEEEILSELTKSSRN